MRPDDVTRDRLVVLASIKRPSGWLEHRREAAITPKVEFRFSPGAAEADRRALATLQQVIDDHVQQRELAESDVVARRSGCESATIRMRTSDRDGAKMCGVFVAGKPQVSG